MRIMPCDESCADQILAILNDAILNSTALYDYKPRTMQSMAAWFAAKRNGNFPVIGAVDGSQLLGFASYGTFRNFPAYKYTVEHSIYVAAEHRRKGIGKTLLTHIIEHAVKQDYHVMVGAIDAQNAVSIAMHQQAGFQYSGTIKHAGFKFGRWLDLVFYQLILTTPAAPVDG